MKCPQCGAWTLTKETRATPKGDTRRRYECANGHRFTTKETVVPTVGVRIPKEKP
jgi:transcriptional regulator NrdR family protein